MPDRRDAYTIDLWPAGRSRPYANHLTIAFDLSSIELCFAQSPDAEGRTIPHSWIVTTPVHLLTFADAIARAVAAYGEQYGRIPDAHADLQRER